MKKAGQSILKGLDEALEHHQGKKTVAREHKFSAADVARIRGSGNVYRDCNLPDADVRQFKAILAAEIIKTLDNKSLSVRKAQSLTGVPAADFLRIQKWHRIEEGHTHVLSCRRSSILALRRSRPL
ncbi:MAG: XRE family transcriptional regulator [Nitrospira sp.]|nr:XRE family transcriptional regulator [Nitrospira sp.]